MKQALITIKGHVQGVCYRISAQEKANELNLTGYAKNMPDDTVEILAQGDEESITKLIDWCKEGSDSAEVTDVQVRYQEPKNVPDSFDTY